MRLPTKRMPELLAPFVSRWHSPSLSQKSDSLHRSANVFIRPNETSVLQTLSHSLRTEQRRYDNRPFRSPRSRHLTLLSMFTRRKPLPCLPSRSAITWATASHLRPLSYCACAAPACYWSCAMLHHDSLCPLRTVMLSSL